MKYTIWMFGRLETQLYWNILVTQPTNIRCYRYQKKVIIWVICVICLAPNLSNRSSRDGHFLTQFLKAQVIINNLKQRSVGEVYKYSSKAEIKIPVHSYKFFAIGVATNNHQAWLTHWSRTWNTLNWFWLTSVLHVCRPLSFGAFFFFFFIFCESLRLTFYVVSLRLTFTAPDNLVLNAFDSCLPCVTIRWQCTNLDQLTKYLLTSVFFTNWIRNCIVHRTILDVLAFCVGSNTCPYPQSIVLHKRSLQESMIALLFL